MDDGMMSPRTERTYFAKQYPLRARFGAELRYAAQQAMESDVLLMELPLGRRMARKLWRACQTERGPRVWE